MSLAAAVLVGASAFAVDNVKVSGDAQVMYSTSDSKNQLSNVVAGGVGAATKSGTLFDKQSSAADAGLNLNISADLAKNSLVTVSAGAGYTVLSTLGLENNFVSNVWGSSHQATTSTTASYGNNPSLAGLNPGGAKVDNASWVNEAWVALSANALTKSTVKVGRMELDTPLAFTEKWSIEKNTFEAAVLINQDLPDTTIVAAFVGNGNGNESFGQNLRSNIAPYGTINGTVAAGSANSLAMGGVVNANGNFGTYGVNGAYAVAAINNSFKPLTAQAWYYDVSKVAQAYWLQADLDAATLGLAGVTAGVQYAAVKVDPTFSQAASDKGTSGTVAAKLGYEMKGMFTASVAYSDVGTKGYLGAANTATGTGASKLYTEAWWNYGQVTAIGAKAYNVTVTSPVNGLFDAALYITSVDQKASDAQDMTEVAVTASKKFGPLDATLAYVSTSFNHKVAPAATTVSNQDSNMVQAYLKLNF